VNDRGPRPSHRLALSRCATAGFVALLLSGIIGTIWLSRQAIVGSWPSTSARSLRERDADAASPFKNARPGVAYVGDEACTRCHRDIAVAYRSHPMGRSLSQVTDAEDGPGAGLPIEHNGVQYTIEHRDGHVLHKASRRGADGKLFAEIEAEIRFALGSGTRGISFLIERDGFLFQSPIAWFAQLRRWDIAPGYGEFSARPDFERVIQPDCLFCHANRFRPVAGTVNRYETPIFEGHAIGCERCHGPGELHVNRAGLSAESDMSIVNPAHLTPVLRDSVCQQCHLQGSFRFARAGRELFDYRPGLPLYRFLAVFLMKKGNGGKFEAVGHDEQMEVSRCFAASKGRLGCISCHDPHRLPAPASRVAYYRERCLACHQEKGCALSLSQRQARGQGEDCIACHMPRPAITNVPHTAATDHRILRGAPRSVPEDPQDASSQPGESPLKDYHWPLLTEEERRDAARDMGVAQGWAARGLKSSPQVARLAAMQGLALLEASVRDRPDDLSAREFLGHTLEVLGRREDALHAFEEVLRVEPGRELAHRSSGRLLALLQRPDLARSEFQKTIAINPWRSHYRLALAGACYQAGDWPGAVTACLEAIHLNPELFAARSLLVQCYLRSHEPDKADAEFQVMLRFYPASREVWQHWYEQQKRAGPGGAVMIGEP
jgi:Tetratricopeptide repeat/Doubled CXXCH motif (Paired_CXXCH_1)/Cytochrome c554 and c-prime